MKRSFIDSNVVLYAFSEDWRADRAREVLNATSHIGVQTLNEFASVSWCKMKLPWATLKAQLQELAILFPAPVPLDHAVHAEGLRLAERYRFSIWDGMMVAAALNVDCDVLWSEDMHDGLIVDQRLKIANPFRTH